MQSIAERIARRQAITPQYPPPPFPPPPPPHSLTRPRTPWQISARSVGGTMPISSSTMMTYITLIDSQSHVLYVAKYLLPRTVCEFIRVQFTETSLKMRNIHQSLLIPSITTMYKLYNIFLNKIMCPFSLRDQIWWRGVPSLLQVYLN